MGAASFATAEDTAEMVVEAGFIEEVGASERINYSGKLRMLSQRIPAAACYSHAGIETEASAKLLQAATAEFDLILNGLQYGEESLGIIGPEKDRKVLVDLEKMYEHWDSLHVKIAHIVDNGGTDEEVVHIADESHQALDIAKHLVSVLVGEYADPTALLQADALTIDIAGRQRMLAQRISKNVCLISSGFDTERAMKELEGARGIYDASANALRFGMPEAGITATKNAEILAKLDDVLALWADVQPILDSVKAGEDIGETQLATTYNAMNSLTGQMNKIVGMYNDDSKLGL
ncbi:type IV pili methyl-accepting chemotaxis transducer N-terminal domain-containing protein [uncultured Tateyamaria sp.]|uniref:type IV pili methyl-accepting chemotaxis transducer N-terminal domain-containing protein n=1 Tax=uncultured Tateyamaria sp. TaxID=455651 RepID=UPI002622B969|nr:type IV pili methyl-accepting chemotaxis transducer N-terminal domain-containing protein [uncultured Tateyamaria sp.]